MAAELPDSLGLGTSGSNDPFWLERIKHQGIAAYNPNSSTYPVFRNVLDFGARGDGITDDTVAINKAIAFGNRCGGGTCDSSTISPALVYFPRGTYLISAPIIAYYYTQLVGDARMPPTLLAAPEFSGIAVIDVNPYIPLGGGRQWYTNQNNFFRAVRNFVIDLRRTPSTFAATGIHWQVAQATSLVNVVFNMSAQPGTMHQGIWMENGSGGFMGDLTFNGGRFGMWVGNQQFTVRNITVYNADTAVFAMWNWGWTFQDIKINDCKVGFDIVTGGGQAAQTVGAEAIIDAVARNTPIFVRTSTASAGKLDGSLALRNIKLRNCPIAVGVVGGAIVLAGGTTTIYAWAQGNVYTGSSPRGGYTQGHISAAPIASVLLDGSGRVRGRPRPQYEDYAVEQFVSARDYGARGDGVTDDTAALAILFRNYAGRAIIFLDAGTYVVRDTITIPAGARIIGEVWSVIAGTGERFNDVRNPRPVVRVGDVGDCGVTEITDIIFTTIAPAAGAIVVEWNVHAPADDPAGAGMWDSHIRLGGAAGTRLEAPDCVRGIPPANCMAAFLALHLTPRSSAYLEGTWIWLADHDLDAAGHAQITLFSGRGVLSQSQGPVWMIGTAEHHTLYQYNLADACDHYLGLAQTETPYFQPSPPAPKPFDIDTRFHDPSTYGMGAAWALHVRRSRGVIIFGAGLYSFFSAYSQACVEQRNCQRAIMSVDRTSRVGLFSVSTVAAQIQLSVERGGDILEKDNVNGFASTITAWSSDN